MYWYNTRRDCIHKDPKDCAFTFMSTGAVENRVSGRCGSGLLVRVDDGSMRVALTAHGIRQRGGRAHDGGAASGADTHQGSSRI